LHQLRNYIVELYTEVDKLELSTPEAPVKKSETVPPSTMEDAAPQIPLAKPEQKRPEVEKRITQNKPEVEEVHEAVEDRVSDISDRMEQPNTKNQEELEPLVEDNKPVVEEKEAPVEIPIAENKPAKKEVEVPKPSTSRGDLYEKFKHSKLTSIKKGISISKRYEIQNELFNNEPESYNDAINSLDNSASLEDAIHLIENNYTEKFGWEADNPLVDELKILCLRRHM
jgi:hypothetical protein